MSYDRVVGLYDLHEPYKDEKAFSTALALVRHLAPQRIVIGGDWVDFYSLSRFASNPARKLDLQSDLDRVVESMERLRGAAPSARLWYLKGNHEARLQKYLWTRAPELDRLRCLNLPALLDLKRLDIEWVDSGILRTASLVWKHGNVVRSKSGLTATAEMERLWRSGVSGHTHRLGQVYKTNDAGYFTWVEAGCLCDLNPEYIEGQTADWQHGVVYAEVERGGNRFMVHPLPIVKGRVVFGGQEVHGVPFKSEAQRKKFHTPEMVKKLGKAKVAEWDDASKGLDLPMKVGVPDAHPSHHKVRKQRNKGR